MDSGKKMIFTNNIPKTGFLITPTDLISRHHRRVSRPVGLPGRDRVPGQLMVGKCLQQSHLPAWDPLLSSGLGHLPSQGSLPGCGTGAPCATGQRVSETPDPEFTQGSHPLDRPASPTEILRALLAGRRVSRLEASCHPRLQTESTQDGTCLCPTLYFVKRTNLTT